MSDSFRSIACHAASITPMEPVFVLPCSHLRTAAFCLLTVFTCAPHSSATSVRLQLTPNILEFGRRRGEVETNPCRGIEYNPTRPRQRYVRQDEIDLAMEVARSRRSVGDQHPSSAYLILALCVKAAYLTVSRPTEMRELHRQSIRPEGVEVPLGKRKAGEQQRVELVLWSPELKAVIDEALALQRTSSMYVLGNTAGQVYTRSGWNTNWSRLMGYCEKEAQARGMLFERFALRDMRPAAVTDRQEEGDDRIIDATGHADERMVRKTYDRRRQRKVRATR